MKQFETIRVCICCGGTIVDRDIRHPNLCLACLETNWHEMQDTLKELNRERLTPEEHNKFPKGRY